MIDKKIKQGIRIIADFPKKGISYKDITPLFQDVDLSNQIIDGFVERLNDIKIDAVVGVESRGFIYGMALANRLRVPFIPFRKKGKLPFNTISQDYELEYGKATLEVHTDAIKNGWNVLIHDDLLATGGTANAAAKLVNRFGANVSVFAFIVELSFLKGSISLTNHTNNIISLTKYQS